MTISSTNFKNQYNGDGSTTGFPYLFRIIQEEDIRVVETSAAGVDSVKVLNTDYTVSGANDDAGGTVTFTTAPIVGTRITLARNAEALQPEHYVENDPFPAASHELALDRVTTVSQTALESASRSLQVGYGTNMTGFSNILPPIAADYAGMAITVKNDLSGFEFLDVADGDVVGPASSTDNAVVRFDGTDGKLVQNSSVIISDTANVTGVNTLTATSVSTSTVSGAALAINGSTSVSIQGLRYPSADGAAGTVITTDGSGNLTFQSPPDGDVGGPASSTDNAIVRFDGTTGKVIQNSSITISDGGNIAGATVSIQGLVYPNADGTAGQVLTTDGSGALYWGAGGGGGSTAWTVVNSNTAMTAGNRYLTTAGSRITLTLPATIAQGEEIEVAAATAGGWTIAQNGGQFIRCGEYPTTVGLTGSLQSRDNYVALKLVCTVANTEFMVVGMGIGNVTVN